MTITKIIEGNELIELALRFLRALIQMNEQTTTKQGREDMFVLGEKLFYKIQCFI